MLNDQNALKENYVLHKTKYLNTSVKSLYNNGLKYCCILYVNYNISHLVISQDYLLSFFKILKLAEKNFNWINNLF